MQCSAVPRLNRRLLAQNLALIVIVAAAVCSYLFLNPRCREIQYPHVHVQSQSTRQGPHYVPAAQAHQFTGPHPGFPSGRRDCQWIWLGALLLSFLVFCPAPLVAPPRNTGGRFHGE